MQLRDQRREETRNIRLDGGKYLRRNFFHRAQVRLGVRERKETSLELGRGKVYPALPTPVEKPRERRFVTVLR